MLEDLQKQIDEERREKVERQKQEQLMRVRLAFYMVAGFGIISMIGGGLYAGGAFDLEISSAGNMVASPSEKRARTQRFLDDSRQNHMQGVLTMHDPWPRVKIGQ
ncbi:hypothetical protein [Magnetococcus sp. PR-3]|uniref:hypothetical protein n=1 Tax=Magnetococcus sp. PR-3 TaxID=3120355 RepID=UPI002FCE3C5E